MTNFTTSLNDNQLLNKLQNLKKHNDGFLFTTHYDNGDYTNYIYLEKISNPQHKYQIWVGLTAFPHNEKGHKDIVEYCNY